MNKASIDIDRLLPFGEMIRGYIEQPFISKADLSEVLRRRGVFINPNDKKETIPWIMCTLLSPDEFDFLREAQRTKEDIPKINTQTIKWNSSSTLLEACPDNFDINSLIELEFSNFFVVGSPNIVQVDSNPNHLRLEFEIERNDYSKNWASTNSKFTGCLELQKFNNDKEVKFVITHTANETKYVATQATKGLVKYFKKTKHIEDEINIVKILFYSFSNNDRIEFFLSLTRDISSNILIFEDVKDLEVAPDGSNKLPIKMEWMEDRIENLKLNGNKLHKTFFVDDKDIYQYMHLYHMNTSYDFDYKGLRGKCVISVGFPDYRSPKEDSAEMEVNIKSLSFHEPSKTITRNEVTKIILQEFNNLKLTNFKKQEKI